MVIYYYYNNNIEFKNSKTIKNIIKSNNSLEIHYKLQKKLYFKVSLPLSTLSIPFIDPSTSMSTISSLYLKGAIS